MIALFASSIFLSAFLLFLVQPMIAKMLLPLLGGSPAVWNTCMLFFQMVLLAGYGYVHALTSRLDDRTQVLAHLGVVAVPLLLLPIGVASGGTAPDPDHPIPWLLSILSLSVGLPFFVLSTTAPLLQKWFASTGHRSAQDPYFLYAASNGGSMLALLAYPAMIEPYVPLKGAQWFSQRGLWSLGYVLLVLSVSCIGWIVRRRAKSGDSVADLSDQAGSPAGTVAPRLGLVTCARWILLAFVPSSLMLSATSYVTLNVAAIPLLWVIPLTLYLLSFILVFARWPHALHRTMIAAMPMLLLLVIYTLLPSEVTVRFWVVILLHLVTLFVVALVCHGELARSRPTTAHLTMYYLLMSVGGALGGLFNGLVAPLIFDSIVEYQMTLVLAACLLPAVEAGRGASSSPAFFPARKVAALSAAWVAVLVVTTLTLLWLATAKGKDLPVLASLVPGVLRVVEQLADSMDVRAKDLAAMVACGIPLIISLWLVKRPVVFGLGLGAILLTAGYWTTVQDDVVIHQERTFFGVLKVEQNKEEQWRKLLHGATNHGKQSLDPPRRDEPLTYYHHAGPIGQAFSAFEGPFLRTRIAVVGLGTATLASYVASPQSLTFYEIDPAVVRIAREPQYFTYWEAAEARGGRLAAVIGDARLKLDEAPDGSYDLIVLDAFSSDAIPVHLITGDAFAMYLRKLTHGGVIAVHISNRYLRLEPVLGNVARDLGLTGLKQFDEESDGKYPGKASSDWVLLARGKEALGPLMTDARWTPLATDPRVGVWTDDFSNVLSVFDWSSDH